jgi:hypothetical protein
MSAPVYLFLFTYLPMLAYGSMVLAHEGPGTYPPSVPAMGEPVTWFLVLHAFSAGCTALTGIEAISNGVPSFQSPEAKNAGKTLIVMAVLMAVLFIGSIGLTQFLAVTPNPQETILSALARRLLDNSPAYYVIQLATMAILAVAANTSFAGFPRLAAILAQDGFLPRQLTGLGDRLVFANGIVLLSAATGFLIILFRGDSHALVPLFAIGVFMAFTLSQAGMVLHWWRERALSRRTWLVKALLNGLGALATALTVAVIGVSKFLEGAWITIILIPLIMFAFLQVRAHYRTVGKQLSLRGLPPAIKPYPPLRVVIPISGVHRGMIDAVTFAESISQHVTAVYIELEPGASTQVMEQWKRWFPDLPLEVLSSPYRSIVRPLLDYLDQVDLEHNDGTLTAIVLPEFVPARWWHGLLHNQTTWLIKTSLLYRRRTLGFQRVIIDVPYHLKK